MIIAHIVFDVEPGQRDLFIASVIEVMKPSKKDDGCVIYEYMADLQDENRFYITEMWTNQQTLDAHLAQPHSQKCMGVLGKISTVTDLKLYSGDLTPMALPH